MASVNEAAKWNGGAVTAELARQLQYIAQTAWHPVSEPPTEADGDELGFVLLWAEGEGIGMCHWSQHAWEYAWTHWAPIHKVVLLPEGEGE